MNNEDQLEAFRLADCRLSEFAADACVFDQNEGFDEDKSCGLKANPVLLYIGDGLLSVPHEVESDSSEVHVHDVNRIYVVYLKSRSTLSLVRRIEFPTVWTYSIYADEFVRCAVGLPAGGERSGLTAHFFFGLNFGRFWGGFKGGHGADSGRI
jgi:hypothetical protein